MIEPGVKFRWHRFGELTSDELYAVLALRQDILVVEQRSPYSDLDFTDQTASHLLGTLGTELVGYARCHGPSKENADGSFGRVVVSRRHRGKGVGNELVQKALARLKGERCDIIIAAQFHLENFYWRFGFVTDGEAYDDVGVPHVRMRLRRKTS